MNGSAVIEKPNIVFLLQYVQGENILNNNSSLNNRYGDKRRFYSSNQTFDYIGYTHTGSNEQIDYVDYSGDSEKSSGVFGPKGLLDKAEIAELRRELRETESTIWHGVISFEEVFGKAYMAGYDDAYRLMTTEFPRFLKSAGLDPKNITWYAGLHQNTENAHIHFSFFENEPSRYRSTDSENLYYSDGIISKRHIRNFKIRAEQRLTDMTAQISKARQETSDLMRDILFTNENGRKYREEIAKEILELKELLPKEGRLSYDSANMAHLKTRIRKIVDAVLKSDILLYKSFENFCTEINKKDEDTKRILTSNGVPEGEWRQFLKAEKYLDDFYRRLGNHVINAARYFKRQEVPAKKRTVTKRILKQARLGLLAQCAYMMINVEKEAFDAFREYLRKLRENEKEISEDMEIDEMELE